MTSSSWVPRSTTTSVSMRRAELCAPSRCAPESCAGVGSPSRQILTEGKSGYHLGTANAWSILSVDPERDLVFVPTGNTSPDFYGGERHGIDFYSSSVVALRASSGEVVWYFQTVHH